jgi:hypothetical protein
MDETTNFISHVSQEMGVFLFLGFFSEENWKFDDLFVLEIPFLLSNLHFKNQNFQNFPSFFCH